MYYVKESTNEKWRVDKFYYTNAKGWGHFIVVKGYKEVDSKILFEVNDPYSYGRCYSDNTLKGKNRYYRIGDIDTATNIWWDYAIVVSKGKIDSKQGIDPRTIRHIYGI